MTQSGDISLFIGILPGAQQRQIVLFPDGQVVADIREQEIATGGYAGSDHGMVAASLLIGVFRAAGWEIDEASNAGAVWMKPLTQDLSDGFDEESPGTPLSAG
jgi:hypothetical protein